MAIGIHPTVDFAFKRLLGSNEHSRVTIHFLNSVLEGQARITSVQFLNTSLESNRPDEKLSVLDILATDQHGRRLNIEVQTRLSAEFSQRLIYYTSRLYCGQLSAGDSYRKLRSAITICVLTSSLQHESSDVHTEYRLRSAAGPQFSDQFQIHLLELPKLQYTDQTIASAPPAERWAYFLKHVHRMSEEDVARLFPDPELFEAAGVLSMISKTELEHMRYSSCLKAQLDEESYRRQAINEGLEQGLQQGIQEGLQQGIEAGKAAGREEGILIGTIQLLQQFLKQPLSSAEQLSGLSLEELRSIAESLRGQLAPSEESRP